MAETIVGGCYQRGNKFYNAHGEEIDGPPKPKTAAKKTATKPKTAAKPKAPAKKTAATE